MISEQLYQLLLLKYPNHDAYWVDDLMDCNMSEFVIVYDRGNEVYDIQCGRSGFDLLISFRSYDDAKEALEYTKNIMVLFV